AFADLSHVCHLHRGAIAPTVVTVTGTDVCAADGVAPGVQVTGAGLHVVVAADTPVACGPRGDAIGWSLIVTNTSDAPLDGVVVTDTVPTGTRYLAGSIDGPGASADTAPVLVWNVGTIPAHTGYTLSFRTTAPTGGGYVVKNAARVVATGVTARTTAAAGVVSDCNGGLAVAKAWEAGCALADGEYVVHLSWANTGVTLLSGAQVVDPLPAGTSFVAADDGGTYADGTVTFAVPVLAPGQRGGADFRVTVTAPAGATFTNAALVKAPGRPLQVTNSVAGVALACDDSNACTIDACAPALGCVFPAEPVGTACDDGDLCTQVDRCADGACVGADFVVCAASDACHVVGACEPTTGVCSDPTGHEGESCDDADACTTASACVAGACVGTADLTCDDGNDCTLDGCDPETGCTVANRDDGAGCDDGDACTQDDGCLAGTCVGADPVVCTASDQCHYPGVCDPATGACSDPALPDGMLCDDGDLCTAEDRCAEGVCAGSDVTCEAPDVCHFPGVCNGATGVCDYDERPGDVPVPIGRHDVGTFGGAASAAVAVNAAGVVVGWAETAGGDAHAFAWTLAGGLEDLAPTAVAARALAINDAGEVVLAVEDAQGARTLVFRGADGAQRNLWLVSSLDTVVWLNAAGEVAGMGLGPNDAPAAFFGEADGTATQLPPDDGVITAVTGLDDAGTVFGTVTLTAGTEHGYVWRSGTFRDVGAGTVVAVAADGAALVQDGDAVRLVATDDTSAAVATGTAVAMNGAGLVVGVDGATQRAFAWTHAGGLVDLGTLGGATSAPSAVNADGLVAGTSDTAFGPAHGFVWTADGGLVDVGALGGASTLLHLSDSGFAAGTSVTAGGTLHLVLWSADRGLEDLGAVSAAAVVTALGEGGQVVGHDGHGFATDAPRTACVVCTVDTDPPTLVCPVFEAVAECVDGGAEVALGAPSVRDDCGAVVVTSDAPPVFPFGTTSVTFTATDLAGNQASCAAVVRVQDETPPELVCPESVTVAADATVCGSVVELDVTAVDGCDGAEDVTVYVSAPEVYPVGVTHAQVIAVDQAGNSASCDVPVTVEDTSEPTLTCPDALSVEAAADACFWAEPLTATLSRQCADDLSVTVDAERYPIGTSEVVFTSDAGEGGLTCTTALTVSDVTAPTVTCNAPTEVAFEDLPVVATARAADACGVTVAIDEVDCADCAAVDQTMTLRSAGPEGGVASWVVTATDPSGNA
ncbi:MAG: HYR domain-containing protein, partial [Deltaproteobacteria bacterium]